LKENGLKQFLVMLFLICFLSACEAESTGETAVDPRLPIEYIEPSTSGECSQACQLSLVDSYFGALDKVYRANSSQEDIDHLFTLLHEDVKYEHLDYGANFNKTAWQAAFTNNLQRGVYTNEEHETIGILNVIHGKNHLAVEYAYGTEDENGEWQQSGEGLFALFGFATGKIILVTEYW
jgi:hypothetical protein